MNDPLQALLQSGALPSSPFPPNSRYHGIALAQMMLPSGETVAYLKRRFVPPPERFALIQEHVVLQGERPDTVAAHYLGDPELYFRLCDANGVLTPAQLTAIVGGRIRITLPEGVPEAAGGGGA